MGEETQKLEKQNPARLWLERHLGKVLLAAVPVMGLALAGWIYDIGSEIAVIREKMKDDEAQWNALLTTNEKVKNLEIETRVNQKLLYLMVEKDIPPKLLHLERLMRGHEDEVDSDDKAEPTSSGLKSRRERLDEFRQQQMEQMQRPLSK